MPGRFGERTRRGHLSMANLITLPPKSTEEVTVEPDRDAAEQFLTAPDPDAVAPTLEAREQELCTCPICTSQD